MSGLSARRKSAMVAGSGSDMAEYLHFCQLYDIVPQRAKSRRLFRKVHNLERRCRVLDTANTELRRTLQTLDENVNHFLSRMADDFEAPVEFPSDAVSQPMSGTCGDEAAQALRSCEDSLKRYTQLLSVCKEEFGFPQQIPNPPKLAQASPLPESPSSVTEHAPQQPWTDLVRQVDDEFAALLVLQDSMLLMNNDNNLGSPLDETMGPRLDGLPALPVPLEDESKGASHSCDSAVSTWSRIADVNTLLSSQLGTAVYHAVLFCRQQKTVLDDLVTKGVLPKSRTVRGSSAELPQDPFGEAKSPASAGSPSEESQPVPQLARNLSVKSLNLARRGSLAESAGETEADAVSEGATQVLVRVPSAVSEPTEPTPSPGPAATESMGNPVPEISTEKARASHTFLGRPGSPIPAERRIQQTVEQLEGKCGMLQKECEALRLCNRDYDALNQELAEKLETSQQLVRRHKTSYTILQESARRTTQEYASLEKKHQSTVAAHIRLVSESKAQIKDMQSEIASLQSMLSQEKLAAEEMNSALKARAQKLNQRHQAARDKLSSMEWQQKQAEEEIDEERSSWMLERERLQSAAHSLKVKADRLQVELQGLRSRLRRQREDVPTVQLPATAALANKADLDNSNSEGDGDESDVFASPSVVVTVTLPGLPQMQADSGEAAEADHESGGESTGEAEGSASHDNSVDVFDDGGSKKDDPPQEDDGQAAAPEKVGPVVVEGLESSSGAQTADARPKSSLGAVFAPVVREPSAKKMDDLVARPASAVSFASEFAFQKADDDRPRVGSSRLVEAPAEWIPGADDDYEDEFDRECRQTSDKELRRRMPAIMRHAAQLQISLRTLQNRLADLQSHRNMAESKAWSEALEGEYSANEDDELPDANSPEFSQQQFESFCEQVSADANTAVWKGLTEPDVSRRALALRLHTMVRYAAWQNSEIEQLFSGVSQLTDANEQVREQYTSVLRRLTATQVALTQSRQDNQQLVEDAKVLTDECESLSQQIQASEKVLEDHVSAQEALKKLQIAEHTITELEDEIERLQNLPPPSAPAQSKDNSDQQRHQMVAKLTRQLIEKEQVISARDRTVRALKEELQRASLVTQERKEDDTTESKPRMAAMSYLPQRLWLADLSTLLQTGWEQVLSARMVYTAGPVGRRKALSVTSETVSSGENKYQNDLADLDLQLQYLDTVWSKVRGLLQTSTSSGSEELHLNAALAAISSNSWDEWERDGTKKSSLTNLISSKHQVSVGVRRQVMGLFGAISFLFRALVHLSTKCADMSIQARK